MKYNSGFGCASCFWLALDIEKKWSIIKLSLYHIRPVWGRSTTTTIVGLFLLISYSTGFQHLLKCLILCCPFANIILWYLTLFHQLRNQRPIVTRFQGQWKSVRERDHTKTIVYKQQHTTTKKEIQCEIDIIHTDVIGKCRRTAAFIWILLGEYHHVSNDRLYQGRS